MGPTEKEGGDEATTVWLNEEASEREGDIDQNGYMGVAIIDDFADAIVPRAELMTQGGSGR